MSERCSKPASFIFDSFLFKIKSQNFTDTWIIFILASQLEEGDGPDERKTESNHDNQWKPRRRVEVAKDPERRLRYRAKRKGSVIRIWPLTKYFQAIIIKKRPKVRKLLYWALKRKAIVFKVGLKLFLYTANTPYLKEIKSMNYPPQL